MPKHPYEATALPGGRKKRYIINSMRFDVDVKYDVQQMCYFDSTLVATDTEDGSTVEIRKQPGVALEGRYDFDDARRLLHGLCVMKHLGPHDAIEPVEVMSPVEDTAEELDSFRDVYLVSPRMTTSLDRLIAGQRVPTHHCAHFTHRLLRALVFIHKAGVMHQELRPTCVLVHQDGTVKVRGFEGARVCSHSMDPTLSAVATPQHLPDNNNHQRRDNEGRNEGRNNEEKERTSARDRSEEDSEDQHRESSSKENDEVASDGALLISPGHLVGLPAWWKAPSPRDETTLPYLESPYLAPELLLQLPYDEGSDVWSAGCILAELLIRRELFRGRHIFDSRYATDTDGRLSSIAALVGEPGIPFRQLVMGEYPTAHRGGSTPMRGKVKLRLLQLLVERNKDLERDQGRAAVVADLLSMMLEPNPRRRISAADAMRHDFFSRTHDPTAVMPEPPTQPPRLGLIECVRAMDGAALRRGLWTEMTSSSPNQ